MRIFVLGVVVCAAAWCQTPQPLPGGYHLPNGWKITPAGRSVVTEDLVLNASVAPDAKAVVALHSGFNPHGLLVIDPVSQEAVQRIALKSAWLGLAWGPSGKRLYVSGGNASGRKPTKAPVYYFDYAGGRLSEAPAGTLEDSTDMRATYWSGLAHHPRKPLLFAANKGTGNDPGHIVVFDTEKNAPAKRIPVEVSPYDLVFSPGGDVLYVSNWSSDTVSVIDTAKLEVVATIPTGDNPNDMELAPDGRLFVACANDNAVVVIDTKKRQVTEKISTALFPRSPEGSTPNALALDAAAKRLYVANADNNSVAVVDVGAPGRSEVAGFIPAGWYPSALALDLKHGKLQVGNSKGLGSYADPLGPHSPLPGTEGRGSVKSLQKGSVNAVDLAEIRTRLKQWTKQVYDNCPYTDELLARARAPKAPSIVPQTVGVASPIRHVIYIIRENRTYDQVFGDLPKGNNDARITIFGRNVTPNAHALAEQFVQFDNLYCDGEVSVDGHSWSTAAYATDFNEKFWPPNYGGHSAAGPAAAYIPGAGHLWDQAARKGLTFRSYGEYTMFSPELKQMVATPRVASLLGHVAPHFKKPGMRDTDNAREFIREFDEYEKRFDSSNPAERLPNFIVMSMPEDHTAGTAPGRHTPRAMVANNDYALGMLVERVTKSRYWPETAIFVIEDDAQDGSDHVDARRTVGLVISPYIRRGTLDSTLYTTSSMLRTIELLLGLQPMSQFDAAANPMYAAFGVEANLSPYTKIEPRIDVNEMNTARAWGARESLAMDFSDVDLAPMRELNEIVWKSVRGADSEMPAPVRRLIFASR